MQVPFWKLLWLSIQAQVPLLGVGAGFVAVQGALGFIYPSLQVPSGGSLLQILASTLVTLAISLTTYRFVNMVITERPRHPSVQLLRHIRDFFGSAPAMALGLPALAGLVVFIYAFSNVKGNIPVFHPLAWDETLDRWDLALHFGRRPWEWLQPLLGYWPVTFLLNIFYNFWFIVMFSVWLHYAFMGPPGVMRTRFFLAFMLLWMVGGGLFAVIFASGGPCFFGAGYLGLSPDPYAELMAYLRRTNEIVPIWALDVQDVLWKLHLAGSAESSISAMPSLHNGTTLLFALASAGWPPWLRRFLWSYVVVIFLGSIHLGWHYAVDGYAGWALALAAWLVSGLLAARWEETAAARRFRRAFAGSPASL